MGSITVVGSYVVDLMSRTPHMPIPGETVLGGPFRMGPGGKGGNQAVAAARLGSKVYMVTKVGEDDFGDIAKANFIKEGIDTKYIFTDDVESTGAALIIVDEHSENMIVVALGACGKVAKEDVLLAERAIEESEIILVQLETSIEAVVTTIEIAKKYNKKVILNPAPYQEFPKEILKSISCITPNETEASLLSGVKVVDEQSAMEAAKIIYEMGVPIVIITLGKKGCLVYCGTEYSSFVPGFKVDAIDTTGAGDAFNGGLAHALSQGMELREAVMYANAVGALSVTKLGTAPSMPYAKEVRELLSKGSK